MYTVQTTDHSPGVNTYSLRRKSLSTWHSRRQINQNYQRGLYCSRKCKSKSELFGPVGDLCPPEPHPPSYGPDRAVLRAICTGFLTFWFVFELCERTGKTDRRTDRRSRHVLQPIGQPHDKYRTKNTGSTHRSTMHKRKMQDQNKQCGNFGLKVT